MADASFLAWPFFDPGHAAWKRRIGEWAAAESPRLIDHRDVDGSCRRLVRGLGDAGFLKAVAPKDHGGLFDGYDVRSLCLARETLAYHDGLADFAFAMQG